MQNNLFRTPSTKGRGKAVRLALMVFVAVSIGAAVYKTLPCCSGNKTQVALAGAPAAALASSEKVEAPAPAGQITAKAGKPAEEKTAVVYYFYTNTRCYSCKTIEAYTRAAMETNFKTGYNGWEVVFKGLNLDEEPNKHFIQDYWLNSKSVVVQKFSGGKALTWGKLEKVWQLLDDKAAFIDYVTNETRKLLDEK